LVDDWGGSTPRLNEALTQFATMLVDRYDVGDTLYWLCDLAREVTDATGTGILLEDVDGSLRYAVASDAKTARLEEIQLDLGEGPCMLAHADKEPVLIPALDTEQRFDGWLPRARAEGVEAVFTLPLLSKGSSIGILDIYREQPSELTDQQLTEAGVVANMITTAVLNRQEYEQSVGRTDQLQAALDARILMEQAKGRVSEAHNVDMATAEEIIHKHAAEQGRPIGEVVRAIAGRNGGPPARGGGTS
jgi:GAF domain-containing protein